MNNTKILRSFTAIFALINISIFSVSAESSPEVIKDYGGRQTFIGLKNKMFGMDHSGMKKPPKVLPHKPIQFPVTSSLSLGVVEKNRIEDPRINITAPFFILGGDDISKKWLMDNKEYLQEINAFGIATNIASMAVMNEVSSIASPLQISAVSIDELVEMFSLTNYPVLISGKEIRQ